MKYVAGWNMPGYIPESEPVEFDTAESAIEYIREELRTVADNEPLQNGMTLTERQAREELAELDSDSGPYQSSEIDGYIYWVIESED